MENHSTEDLYANVYVRVYVSVSMSVCKMTPYRTVENKETKCRSKKKCRMTKRRYRKKTYNMRLLRAGIERKSTLEKMRTRKTLCRELFFAKFFSL